MQANDINCVGDALIQGDMQVNGTINGKTIATDGNAKIIEVAKVLDLSTANNEVQIDLPSGYVCNPTALGSGACIGIYSYDDKTAAWSTDATVQFSTVEAQGGTTVSNSDTISHGLMTTKGLVPFCKTYIKAKVTTAAVGTSPKVLIHATIYCKKI